MNLDQPKTEHNYTKLGFKKTKVPEAAWKPLLQFYEKYKDQAQTELWPRGYTYVNTWESPSHMVSFDNGNFREGGSIKHQIWDLCKPIIEKWVGKPVQPTSFYGIRIYKDKAILATHVDRLPLVSSAIINIAQDVNEDWPVEIYDHDGKAHNVTMKPGDMVLYESHTVLHGRPFPLNGSYYANVFVHYQPLDHMENNRIDRERASSDNNHNKNGNKVSSLVRSMAERYAKIGGHEQGNHEDHIISKHLKEIEEEEEEERNRNKSEYTFNPEDEPGEALRAAASQGDSAAVELLLQNHQNDLTNIINSGDDHEWQALHEAVRAGHLEVVKYLVEMGADIGKKTIDEETPLALARRFLSEDDAVVEYLVSIGAPE
eukprot:CAMPEP_0170074378 /NCGR_PEP_ID=MMETSP0019_2-20121128/11679_1 /TAXON_ID=98059 /ORGANISM="Dinobryon sp., Strain UTEXLB2267" /LENGTH=372 /DNA_ID=CAMNT_0010284615 /DNA_START=359 /DNA_END=1477 /DNA_ORIENTATION=+